MKHKILRNTIVAGSLSAMLIVPSLAQELNVRPISAKEPAVLPIRYELKHWSETFINQLSSQYDVGSIFTDKDFNDSITSEDFQKLIQTTIDKEYVYVSEETTRESIVYELTKIWAEKTGKELETIPVIKMLIYSDTDQIDIKYSHGITVAYMRDIAKGRDTGKFDPKANVTYGEVAALISNTKKAIKDDLESDKKSIAAGKFETRGSCERYDIIDGKVIFDFELISHYTEPKELQFGSGQQFEITITDENGEEVYRYSDDKFFTMALIMKTLNPGEVLKWQDEWDMTNKEGEKLTSGKYKAEIKIMVIPKENDEKIEDSELTTTIDFIL